MKDLFDPKFIEDCAQSTGFIKRKSKLSGSLFLRLMLLQSVSHDCLSLNQLCTESLEQEGLSISKQGLDNRMKKESADFISKLLEKQLSTQFSVLMKPDIFKPFERVLIKDSTKFDLPAVLAGVYPGFGGSASPANCCIQYEFDLKSTYIADLEVTPGRKNDAGDALDKKEEVKSGDLIIRDLGYYSLSSLKSIAESQAYYLSKLGQTTKVYELKGEEYTELQMDKLYGRMKKNRITTMRKNVFLGSDKLPTNLIVTLVPDQVREERIRKRQKENKKKGFQTSDDYLARAGLNLFVTNVCQEKLTLETILKIYHLRWQIELVFKAWKSIFGIHIIHRMKPDRFKCVLYSKLLFICLCWQMVMPLRNSIYNSSKKWLSFNKCFKTLRRYALDLRQVLTRQMDRIEEFICKIYCWLATGHWLEKKKNRLGFENIISIKL